MIIFIKIYNMIIQQPSEIPQPQPSRPDQQFGQYTLEYFIQDNWWYLVGIAIILVIVFGYSWYIRSKKKDNNEVEN